MSKDFIKIKRLQPTNVEAQTADVIREINKDVWRNLVRSAFMFTKRLKGNLDNTVVRVISGGLLGSVFVETDQPRMDVIMGAGLGINYAPEVERRDHYMAKTIDETESRIDKLMGAV